MTTTEADSPARSVWLMFLVRGAGILLTSAVVGTGVGWIVGYAHFVATGNLEESGRNAIAGGIAGPVLWLAVYLKLIRPKPDLEAACVIAVSSLVFGVIGALFVRLGWRWNLLPIVASCLGMLLASFSYFGRSERKAGLSEKGIRSRIAEGACVLICSFIVGCGEGFLQGIVAFRAFLQDGFEGLTMAGMMGASAGGVYAAIVCPIIYFLCLRGRLNLHSATKVIVITSISGLVSALLVGWVSAFVTLVVLIMTSPFAPGASSANIQTNAVKDSPDVGAV